MTRFYEPEPFSEAEEAAHDAWMKAHFPQAAGAEWDLDEAMARLTGLPPDPAVDAVVRRQWPQETRRSS